MSEERRWCCGAYHAQLRELDDEDPKGLKNFVRMDTSSFCDLLDKVSSLISKEDTTMSQPISVGERLAVTL